MFFNLNLVNGGRKKINISQNIAIQKENNFGILIIGILLSNDLLIIFATEKTSIGFGSPK